MASDCGYEAGGMVPGGRDRPVGGLREVRHGVQAAIKGAGGGGSWDEGVRGVGEDGAGAGGPDEVLGYLDASDATESVYAPGGGDGEQEDGTLETVGIPFSAELAEVVIDWIEGYCYIPEGKFVGRPVRLRDWQKNDIRKIYGSPTRRAIISMGRKNAKTTTSSFLLLCHLCGPLAVRNSQLYSAATSRDQAAILFSLAAKIVRISPDLRAVVIVKDSAKELVCPEIGTVYKALSADASTNLGKSPIMVLHDELGAVRGPRSNLYEALETAAGAHMSPLSIIFSTQAPTDADLLSLLIDDALTGADPRVKLIFRTASEDLDPFSEEAIRQANPAFGDFLNSAEVLDQAASAKRMPSREAAYRNLILNQRIDGNDPLISRTVWSECGGEPKPFVGPVWAGLDLSARNDLTALVLLGRDEDGNWSVRPDFFAPEQGLMDRASRDRAPYDLWAQQGYLITTPGATVDYEWVARRLIELCEEHEVATISFDRWRIDLLKNEITKLGAELPLEPFGQGYKSMAPAIDNLEAALLNRQIRHGNHPVLTWCASNAIATRDPAGNRKLDKAKATGRIDGIVALTMAFGVADMNVDEYATGGLVLL